MPANSRNTEPRSIPCCSANRREKTGRHRDINIPRKNGKLQVSKRKSGTQVRSEEEKILSTANSQV